MTEMEARALARAINQEYSGVLAVALPLGQDHWGVRVTQQRSGCMPVTMSFERAHAAQRVYPTPYGDMLATAEAQRRTAS